MNRRDFFKVALAAPVLGLGDWQKLTEPDLLWTPTHSSAFGEIWLYDSGNNLIDCFAYDGNGDFRTCQGQNEWIVPSGGVPIRQGIKFPMFINEEQEAPQHRRQWLDPA